MKASQAAMQRSMRSGILKSGRRQGAEKRAMRRSKTKSTNTTMTRVSSRMKECLKKAETARIRTLKWFMNSRKKGATLI